MGIDKWTCSESVSGHSLSDVHGKCMYCGLKYSSVQPMPNAGSFPVSDATIYYDRFYNPDYGGHNLDY